MKKVIVAGFGPFGGYPANTTELIVQDIHQSIISGYNVHSVLLKAEISPENRAKKLVLLAQDIGARAIITIGMASERIGLCVEGVASNLILGKYVPRELNNTPVDNGRSCFENIVLDLGPWRVPFFQQQCRAQKIPVMETSSDAGYFCCNQLMYQYAVLQLLFDEVADIPLPPFIFLHTPCSPEAVADAKLFATAGKTTMTLAQIKRGLKILLENALI